MTSDISKAIEITLQLYGKLVIALIGIIVPFIIILMQIFKEGVEKLKKQYENKSKQSEENINNQVTKKSENNQINIDEIEKNIKELRVIQDNAKKELRLLDPITHIRCLFGCLLLSFIFLVVSFFIINTLWVFLSIVGSFVLFIVSIYFLWRLIEIIIRAKNVIDEDKNDKELILIEALNKLIENGTQSFLKDVFILINGVLIDKDNLEIALHVDKKNIVPVVFNNKELRLVKNVEIGLVFPQEFIVEKNSSYSTFISEDEQIFRRKIDYVQGKTNLKLKPLIVTPLKKGQYTIQTFIKAENVESIYKIIILNIK